MMRRGGSHLGDLMPERGPGGRCPRDGAELVRSTIGGRTSWWCPAPPALRRCRSRPATAASVPELGQDLLGVAVGLHVVPGALDLAVGPTRNVERMTPTDFLPYRVFSPHAP